MRGGYLCFLVTVTEVSGSREITSSPGWKWMKLSNFIPDY